MINSLRKKGTGALLDNRTPEEQKKDYRFEEMVASIQPVKWEEKKEYRRFPIVSQNGSGSCVSFSLAKVLGVMHQVNEGEWIDFSPGFVYQQRINKPNDGMIAADAWNIARDKGILLDVFFPSENKTDAQLDAYKVKDYERDIARVFRVPNYVIIPAGDIDTIASIIQKTKKAVMVWFYFTTSEWNRGVPVILNSALVSYGANASRHSVSACDYTLYKGKKALVISDSWGTSSGIKGQRIITEDFFKKRNIYSAYPINFRFQEGTDNKPKHNFTRDIEYGTLNSPDVRALQDCLKYDGTFPINTDSTGNYYGITRKAVYDFQVKHKVASMAELNALNGMRVGAKTRLKLNELYGL